MNRILLVDQPLYIKANTNVQLLISSLDVIHSFSLASLGIKVDAGLCREILLLVYLYLFLFTTRYYNADICNHVILYNLLILLYVTFILNIS